MSIFPTLTEPQIIFKIVLQLIFIIIVILTMTNIIKTKYFLIGALLWLGALIVKNIYLLIK